MNRIRELLDTQAGRYLGYGLAGLGVLLAGWLIVGQFGGGIAARSAQRMFIDSNTGEQFQYTISKGEMIPVPSPHSDGARVGYEAEPCYWTKEGGVKEDPTWVLPKVKIDTAAGPTFCADCGRLVVPRNPAASPRRPSSPHGSRIQAAPGQCGRNG